MKNRLLVLMTIAFYSCSEPQPERIQGDWITGNEATQLKTIEKQFRGFDKTMVEIGYRYQELYWAGKDENWEYANYQLEKIKTAMELGLERRPKRAKSSEAFLEKGLPEMKKAVNSQDKVIFNNSFQMLTANCNACHMKENVEYFTVNLPEARQSPIKK